MKYISTRGSTPPLNFEDVLLTGLAPDGGLFIPESWPQFDPDQLRALSGLPYAEVAKHVITPFVENDIASPVLERMLGEVYGRGFSHSAIAPLVQISPNVWVMELFHGPTLAFKDFGARFMAQCLARMGKRVHPPRDSPDLPVVTWAVCCSLRMRRALRVAHQYSLAS